MNDFLPAFEFSVWWDYLHYGFCNLLCFVGPYLAGYCHGILRKVIFQWEFRGGVLFRMNSLWSVDGWDRSGRCTVFVYFCFDGAAEQGFVVLEKCGILYIIQTWTER